MFDKNKYMREYYQKHLEKMRERRRRQHQK